MKACGIVAEYNPFHNGHAYQIEHIRKELAPDVIIAVMSGNFLQRGEPALVDKWTRTKMALAGGVDLVIELPVYFSTQAADFFARGAIDILQALDVDGISFGVEEGSATDFLKAAKWLDENEALFARELKKNPHPEWPYAKRVEQTLQKWAPDFPLYLNSPNNQLGFAYTKEIVRRQLDQNIQIAPLPRKDAGYMDARLNEEGSIASATAIRKALFAGEDVSSYIPESSYTYLEQAQKQMVSWADYFPMLAYQLTVQPTTELKKLYEMTEGLEHRLQGAIEDATDFSSFMKNIQTKRYTNTRLQRLLVYTLLQMTKEEVEKAFKQETPLRVLGFNAQGQAYLRKHKKRLDTRLVSNIQQNNQKPFFLDIRAGKIYRLGRRNEISEQDFTQKPVKRD